MTLYCYIKKRGDIPVPEAKGVIGALEKNGHKCVLSSADAELLGMSDFAAQSPERCDLIVSIGGDGTALRAAKIAIEYGKPLLGINAGRLGRLCAVNASEAEMIDEKFILGLIRSERTVLSAKINGREEIAVNDMSVSKDDFGATITLHIASPSIGETSIRGDGVVIATPTGSTAYSFSAGGPVLSPDAKSLAVTPICPHSGFSRSIVIPEDSEVSVCAPNKNEASPYVYVDGIKKGVLEGTLKVYKNKDKLVLLVSKTGIAV